MKPFIVVLIGISLAALSCRKEEPSLPDCISTMTATFVKSEQTCPTHASVKAYSFQSREVYVFDPGDCGADMAMDVYDDRCEYLGMLGGIAGLSKINGVEFISNATYLRTIWKN